MNIELTDLKDAVAIRPHHLRLDDLWDALEGKKDPVTLAEEVVAKSVKQAEEGDPSGYYADLLGEDLKCVEQYKGGLIAFYTTLQQLHDGALIHIDLQPDGMCKACAIGKHCLSTNFKLGGYDIDTFSLEKRDLESFRDHLQERGFIPGKDFFVLPTRHTLYNLRGGTFLRSSASEPSIVQLDSLIVPVGVMRTF